MRYVCRDQFPVSNARRILTCFLSIMVALLLFHFLLVIVVVFIIVFQGLRTFRAGKAGPSGKPSRIRKSKSRSRRIQSESGIPRSIAQILPDSIEQWRVVHVSSFGNLLVRYRTNDASHYPPLCLCSSKLEGFGLLKDQEAEHLVSEIEDNINEVLLCDAVEHPGEISLKVEEHSLYEVEHSLKTLKEEQE